MNPAIACPSSEQLQELLDGRLSQTEHGQLLAHAETCEICQQTLASLSAGSQSWEGAARKILEQSPQQESELKRLMEQIRARHSGGAETTDGSGAGESSSLAFLSPAERADQIGKLDHYEVLEVIGRGGMGVVLKAFDPVLQRVVAIKVLAPQLATSANARRRFTRESVAAAAVSHDHVVSIHAVAEANGLPYLVMPFVAGESLQELLDRKGPLELKEILRIGMQIAAGLAAAHSQGLVHRDIKPANILLENGVQRVKITDFGLARAVDDASLTQSGVLAGTPQYMAPEQARGEAVDTRADLFSLGSVLYALCTGHSPFRASTTLGVIKRVCEEAARPIREVNPDIPAWLCEIIDKLHAKTPADRFQSAKEVATLLEQHLAHLQQPFVAPMPGRIAAPRVSTVTRSAYPSRKKAAWGAVGLLLMGGTAFLVQSAVSNTAVPWPIWMIEAAGLLGVYLGCVRNWTMWKMPIGFWIGLVPLVLVYLLAVASLQHHLSAPIAQALAIVLTVSAWAYGLPYLGLMLVQTRREALLTSLPVPEPKPYRMVLGLGLSLLLTPPFLMGWVGERVHGFRTIMEDPTGLAKVKFEFDDPSMHVEFYAGEVFETHPTHGPRSYYVPAASWRHEWWAFKDGKRLPRERLNLTPGETRTVRVAAAPAVERLAGRWTVVSQTPEGTMWQGFGGPKPWERLDALEFDGETLTQYERRSDAPEAFQKVGVVLESGASPKRIDVLADTGRLYTKGIYRLEGDVLRLCMAHASKPRPTSFDTLHRLTTCVRTNSELARLQGRWLVESQEKEGTPVPDDVRTAALQIVGDRLKIEKQSGGWEEPFVLNPHKSPAEIDVPGSVTDGRGIYRLEGDRLTLCIGPKDAMRPVQFASRPGDYVLTVCRRVQNAVDDQLRVQGTWVGVSGERNGGEALPSQEVQRVRVEFEGKFMRVQMPGGFQDEGVFDLDATRQPKTLSVTRVEGGNRLAILEGIYRFHGEELTICMGEPGELPAGFQTRPGTRLLLITLKRGRVDGTTAPSEPAVQPPNEQTLLTFNVEFEPNQTTLDAKIYEAEFVRAIQEASRSRDSRIILRGHSDPTKVLMDFVRAGQAKGVLTKSVGPNQGIRPGPIIYTFHNQPFDLKDTARVVELIRQGAVDGVEPDAKATLQAAINLSALRARLVMDALFQTAQAKKLAIPTRVELQGADIADAFFPKPGNIGEARQNMRVEVSVQGPKS